jgi:hypothetical protein
VINIGPAQCDDEGISLADPRNVALEEEFTQFLKKLVNCQNLNDIKNSPPLFHLRLQKGLQRRFPMMSHKRSVTTLMFFLTRTSLASHECVCVGQNTNFVPMDGPCVKMHTLCQWMCRRPDSPPAQKAPSIMLVSLCRPRWFSFFLSTHLP